MPVCRRQLARWGQLAMAFAGVLPAAGSAGIETRDPPGFVEPLSGAELVRLSAGSFVIGSPLSEAGRGIDERQHRVTLSRDFYLGRYEVTQDQWRRVTGASPSHFAACGGRCPAERVNFFEIEGFLARLNGHDRRHHYRLPTEAEWEYACRAGTSTPFNTGTALSAEEANYDGTSPYPPGAKGRFRAAPTPVGTFAPNRWGLFDMHGNMWEWCADWYGPYSDQAATDPRGPSTGEKRVIRGGSWIFDANSARCALRYTHRPQDRGFSLGVRLAAD